MQSVVLHHYPGFVFRDGEKKLWNPILKKAYKNRPEERVRLQCVEYLIREAGFSASKISFESPVNLANDKTKSRTDIIYFNREFKPVLLIECKAPEIPLTENTSIQIARYNQQVNAPFLLITNGIEDHWYKTDRREVFSLNEIPEEFAVKNSITLDFDYWNSRGFAGPKSHPATRKWITNSCKFLYNSPQETPVRYFKFEGGPKEFYLPNYYRIFNRDNKTRLALALTATPFGATKLNAILNLNGDNVALLSASLDMIASEEAKNTIIQSKNGEQTKDISNILDASFSVELQKLTEPIIDLLFPY